MTGANNVIWIVGASSGIGLALARAYAQTASESNPVSLILSARRQALLQQIQTDLEHPFPHLSVFVQPMDISDESSVMAASHTIAERFHGVNQVLINAGTCEYINSVAIDMDSVKRVMNTNFFGALNVVNGALPLLRRAAVNKPSQAQLVFVSSSVTYQALPRAGAYGASKAALSYFAESLKLDLQHEGIDVRVVSPGFVSTPLTDQNDFPMPGKVSAQEAAQRMIAGLQTSTFDVHFPRRFTWPLKVISWLPYRFKHWLLGKTSRHVPPDNPAGKDEQTATTQFTD